MKILMVSPTLGDAYGQEQVMRSSTALLRQAGHRVYLLGATQVGPVPPCDGFYSISGMGSIHTLSAPRKVQNLHDEAKAFVGAVGPDIIHLIDQFDFRLMQDFAENYPCILTAHTVAPTCPASHRLTNKTQVCTYKSGIACLYHQREHGCLSHFKGMIRKTHAIQNYLLKRKMLRRFPTIAAISRYIQGTLLADGWPKEKVQLIYNPVPIPEIRPLPWPDAPGNLIVSACRLVPLKGISYLIEALGKIKDQDWTLWICGDGPERKNLTEQVDTLGISKRVKFLGHTTPSDTQRFIASARIFAQPNIGPEGFGLSVAEASSLGIPVVGFDIPALNEIIEDGKSGFLTASRDTFKLSEAIQTLLTNETIWNEMSKRGPSLVEARFSPQMHLSQTLHAYEYSLRHFKNSRVLELGTHIPAT